MSESVTDKSKSCFFDRQPILFWIILIILFSVGLGIRVYKIDSQPLAGREYYSVIEARSMYYLNVESAPEWKKEVAASQKQERMVPLPTIEIVAYVIYHLAGGEYPWIVRIFSSCAWIAGGVVLFLIVRKVSNKDTAVCSLVPYLFIPFGVEISRRFQLEPLMIMAMLFSIYAIVLYDEKPDVRRAIIAGLVTTVAVVIRPLCIFMIAGVFISLIIARQGIRRSLVDRTCWLFVLTALLPMILLYCYDTFFLNTYAVTIYESTFFQPQLLFTSFFYKNWWLTMGRTVGQIWFIIAFIGTFAYRNRISRNLLIGLWCGYIVFAIVFPYHFSTHGYLHLQLVPLLSICIGQIGALMLLNIMKVKRRWMLTTLQTIFIGILVFFAVFGVIKSFDRVIVTEEYANQYKNRITAAEEIGEHVNHSTKVILLSGDIWHFYQYYGWIDAERWPVAGDLKAERLFTGQPNMTAEERFYTRYNDNYPEFFIITYFPAFNQQKDLEDFLTVRFPVLASTDEYLIFDLR